MLPATNTLLNNRWKYAHKNQRIFCPVESEMRITQLYPTLVLVIIMGPGTMTKELWLTR